MNNALMGSFAGPESPNPCSQRMKLLAMGSDFFVGDGSKSSTKKMVKPKVNKRTRKGFSNGTNLTHYMALLVMLVLLKQ